MSDELRRIMQVEAAMRRITDPLEDARRLIDPLGEAYKHLGAGAPTLAFLGREEEGRRKLMSHLLPSEDWINTASEIVRQRKLLEGPIEEARRLGLFAPQSERREMMSQALEARRAFESMFRLPEIEELSQLSREALKAAEVWKHLTGSHETLRVAMGEMRSPWLQIEDKLASARAFADLIAIGQGVTSPSVFKAGFAEALRLKLGDWRDPIAATQDVWIDPMSRWAFYRDQGFDQNLTDFSPQAFDESLRIAGLGGEEIEIETEEDEDGFARVRYAFAELHRFEVAMRRFISRVMQDAFGETWMKHRLPNGMLDEWVAKRDKAVKAGETEQPLIDYADFSDYRAIIERKDNWRDVFAPVFGRAEDVRESLQRLFPVRIATMHARIITQDDQLLLSVETKRILRAIRLRG